MEKVIKYNKAPISELICGITFNSGLLSNANIIYEIINTYKSDYPNITLNPPLADEELSDYKLNRNINSNNTGAILYRLKSLDGKWLLQLQNNKVYLNWVRADNKSVGSYPGFDLIYEQFNTICKHVVEKIVESDKDIDIGKYIKQFELQYQDRINYQEHITDLSGIQQLIEIKPPVFPPFGLEDENICPNNINSRYTYPMRKLGGHGTIAINTMTDTLFNDQLLVLESCVKGKIETISMDEWFNIVNKIQVKLFESLFTGSTLDKWK